MAKLSEKLEFFKGLGGQSLVDDILATQEHFKRANQRHAVAQSVTPGKWRIVGAVEQVMRLENGLRLACEYGWVELKWLAANCLHVRQGIDPTEFENYFSYAVHKTDWLNVQLDVIDGTDALVVKTASHVYRIGKQPLRLDVETLDGNIVCIDSLGIQRRDDGAVRLSMKLHPEETCYGLGERAETLNLRGKRYSLWNTDPPKPFASGDDPLYYSIPFYLGVHDEVSYGILWDNSSRGWVDVGHEISSELTFESESGALSYYLFAGDEVNSVLARYTELTGRITMPPLWFLGYQQCRWSYYPQENVLKLAQDFRKREIPCDVLYLDIHYMDGYRVFTWDRARFPQPEQMIKTLHQQGFKVVVILDPGIKVDPKYGPYQSGIEHDVFLRYSDGTLAAGSVWPGMCHFPDFTRPEVRDWWSMQCQPLLNTGVDGVWNDMCEPAIFLPDITGTLPDYTQHSGDGHAGTHLEYHNVYGMQMARASLQALETHKPDARPVNMLRAGYAGTQRYASSWTGDNSANWEHLRLSISMTLNMGLSGAPMTGPDIGGFFGNADGELFTRWLQAACFLPYFRGHSELRTAPHEPWAFGQPYEVINRVTIELRYRLLPYLYSVVAQAAEYGWPIIRPIFTAEPHNPNIRSVDDCYLLGDSLLVAPVLVKGAVGRSVYLPAGADWYDYWTNERYEGGQTIEVTAPLERLPLFVRAGSAIPHWPEMQYVGQKTVEKLTLRCYPGSHETVLYEDAGEGLAYREGQYRWVYITCVEDKDHLTINRRAAGAYESTYSSISLEVVGLNDEPYEIRVDRQGAPLWFYDDDVLEIQTDSFKTIEIVRKPSSSDPTLLSRPW